MRTRTPFVGSLIAVAMLSGLAPAAPAGAAHGSAIKCRDGADKVRPLTLRVEGQPATGHYAIPRDPNGLVVFGHGYGHTSLSWVEHMKEAARRGLIAVTMDYRGLEVFPDTDGDGLPQSRGWNAMAGAEDLLAAALVFEAACRVDTVTIFGVSMGANMSGLAVALAGERGITRADGETPLFDHWVDVEGAVNLIETYAAARLAAGANDTARNARDDIEAENGGTFEERPDEYRRRTVVARLDDIESSGIEGIIAIHGLDDGLVPYNQSRELVALTRGAAIPTEMVTIGRRDEDSERETTLTGHAVGAVYPDYTSPLAGHASEKSTTHIVMQTALERLWALVEGDTPADRECVVNGQVPAPAARACFP